MIDQIKFGTDGWRAVIGDTYTVKNISRVAEGTALWVKQQSKEPSIVIGHDCRFNGRLFMETAIKVYLNHGIKVYYADGFVSTPMVSMGTKRYGANIGVVLTASHNPPSYGGYKLKSNYGGPLLPDKIQEVEDLIPDHIDASVLNISLEDAIADGRLIQVDLETQYIDAVTEALKTGAKEITLLNAKGKPTKNKVSTSYGAERSCKFAISALTQAADGKKTWRAAVPGDGFTY